MPETTTAYRTCPFCEATCGLEVTVSDGSVTRVRGDADDVFSKGFLCPKGVSLKDLHEDPDRLRTPMIRETPFVPVVADAGSPMLAGVSGVSAIPPLAGLSLTQPRKETTALYPPRRGYARAMRARAIAATFAAVRRHSAP